MLDRLRAWLTLLRAPDDDPDHGARPPHTREGHYDPWISDIAGIGTETERQKRLHELERQGSRDHGWSVGFETGYAKGEEAEKQKQKMSKQAGETNRWETNVDSYERAVREWKERASRIGRPGEEQESGNEQSSRTAASR